MIASRSGSGAQPSVRAALKQIPYAAAPADPLGDGRVGSRRIKRDFLVLGPDRRSCRRSYASLEPLHERIARRDRRRIVYVASHQQLSVRTGALVHIRSAGAKERARTTALPA